MSVSETSPIYRILDLSRWAPSGDNSQPWRFKIIADDQAQVYVYLRDLSFFNRDHFATYIAAGALLASIRIAASVCGGQVDIQKSADSDFARLVYDVRYTAQPGLGVDALAPFLPTRSVCRHAYKTRMIEKSVKDTLEQAVGSDYEIVWYEGRQKLDIIRALVVNGKIRIFSSDVFAEYNRAIDWEHKTSETKMPATAIGLSRPTLFMASFLMRSWICFITFNKYLLGYLLPVTEMDIVPGMMCGAHLVIKARSLPLSADDYVSAGEAVQRFWLTAAQQGLLHQPSMTPVIFSQYAQSCELTSQRTDVRHLLLKLRALMLRITGGADELDKTVWMGRIGYGVQGRSRSIRRPLAELLED